MRKMKGIMLGVLSVLALGLFVVTGIKASAEENTTNGTYTLAPTTFWTSTSNSNASVTSSGIFSVSKNGKAKQQNFGTRAASQSGCILKNNTYKTWETEVLYGGQRDITVTLNLSDTQKADIIVFGYYANSSSGKVTIDGEELTPTDSTISSTEFRKTVTSTTVISGVSNFALLEIDVIVYSSSRELTSLEVTNTKDYSVGDTFDPNLLHVIASYDDSTLVDLCSDQYSVTLTKDNATVTTFTTFGTYNAVVTAVDAQVSKNFDIVISETFIYKFTDFSTSTTATDVTVLEDKIVVKNAKYSTGRTNTFEGVSYENYLQSSEIDFTLDKKAEISIYATQSSNVEFVNDRSTYIKYVGENSEYIISMTGHTPVMKPSNGSTVTSFTKCVLPAGTYKFVSPMGSLNLYGMKIDYSTEKDSMPIDNAVNFQWQLDSTKTIVRFIGTLSGINDLTKLDNVYVDVVLINGTSNPHHASIEITKVYKAVIGSGDSTKETAVAGIYYAVCSISALDALKSTANTTDGVTGNWTIKSKLYYTYNDVDNVISTVSAVSGF